MREALREQEFCAFVPGSRVFHLLLHEAGTVGGYANGRVVVHLDRGDTQEVTEFYLNEEIDLYET